MRPTNLPILLIVALFGVALIGGGCTDSGRYPDQSQSTKVEADAIRDQARSRKAVIDREQDERATAIAFRERQIKDKASQDREAIVIEFQKPRPALQRQADEVRSKAERERADLDRTLAETLRNPGDRNEAQIRADSNAKRAEIDRVQAARIAEVNAETAKLDSQARERTEAINKKEAEQLAKTTEELAESKRSAAERRLAVDRETTEKLDRLGTASSKQTASNREQSQRDSEITSAIRSDLARDGKLVSKAADVTVTTSDGVVVLTGSVPSEVERKAVVARASDMAGVRRVDDRLVVR